MSVFCHTIDNSDENHQASLKWNQQAMDAADSGRFKLLENGSSAVESGFGSSVGCNPSRMIQASLRNQISQIKRGFVRHNPFFYSWVQDDLCALLRGPRWFFKDLRWKWFVCVLVFSLLVVSLPQFQLIEWRWKWFNLPVEGSWLLFKKR